MLNCLNPRIAWKCGTILSKDGIPNCPRLVFSFDEAYHYWLGIATTHTLALELMSKNEIPLPCGKCVHCLIRKRKDMATRLSCESRMHETSCFLTLTYDEATVPVTDFRPFGDADKMFERGGENLPFRTLCPRDLTNFMKRLRIYLARHFGIKSGLRFFAVGEYGSKTHRPHYHILLFGWKPNDLILHQNRGNYCTYLSSIVSRCWKFGFSEVGLVNNGVARYCARYVTKKMVKLINDDLRSRCVCPEFTRCSNRNGGIGSPYVDMYHDQLARLGLVNLRNDNGNVTHHGIPLYFVRRLRNKYQSDFLQLRDKRISFVKSAVHAPLEDIIAKSEFMQHQINQEFEKDIL